MPPARLGVSIHRIETGQRYLNYNGEPYTSFLESSIVDQDLTFCGGGECSLRTGSWVQYSLPFQFKITAFSFGIDPNCRPDGFKYWTFEAFDSEGWRPLLYAARAPEPYDREVFELMGAADLASTRFRIRLDQPESESESEEDDDHDHACRCMHISGLELYGTIMPPWRID